MEIVTNDMYVRIGLMRLANLFAVSGNAYSATALFYIGLTLVGKIQGQMGMGLIVPLLLIGAKT